MFCTELIRNYLQDQLNVDTDSLDQGTLARRWSTAAPETFISGRGDLEISPQETLQFAFQQMSADDGLVRFFAETAPQIPNIFFDPQETDRTHLVPFMPPWLLDDADPDTQVDQELRERLDQIAAQDLELTSLLAMMSTSRNEGGLGLRYIEEPPSNYWERDGITAYRDGSGDCNAFSAIFYALAARAGLNPNFVEIVAYDDGAQFIPVSHLAVQIQNGAQLVDPSNGVILDENLYQYYPISELEMMAYALLGIVNHNHPEELSAEEIENWQEYFLLSAQQLAPSNYLIQRSLWAFYLETGNSERAQLHQERALSINPSNQTHW